MFGKDSVQGHNQCITEAVSNLPFRSIFSYFLLVKIVMVMHCLEQIGLSFRFWLCWIKRLKNCLCIECV